MMPEPVEGAGGATGRARTHRRALLPLAVLACLTTGCWYAPPFMSVLADGRRICAPRPPVSAEDLQAVFDTRGPWWAGADGGFPVDLPDGRRLWLFGDTFVGRVDPTTRAYLDGNSLAPNSMLVQSGRCFDVRLGGRPGGPARPALVHPDPTAVWWPLAGVFDPSTSTVRITAMRQSARHIWTNRGMDLLTLSWPSLALVQHQELPFTSATGGPALGGTLLIREGWMYAYGAPVRRNGGTFVARTAWPLETVPVWEYWSRTGWQDEPAAAAPMDTGTTAVNSALQVRVVNRRFVAVGKPNEGIDTRVLQLSAPDPWGPWTLDGNLATAPRRAHDSWNYGARVVDVGGNLVTLQSENTLSWTSILGDTLRYGVKVTPYAVK